MAKNFFEKVYEFVKKIPYGYVTSYGHVATSLGSPRAARQVGWALGAMPASLSDVPWWRVINSRGYLSIRKDDPNAKNIQRSFLENEGIIVDENFVVDLKKYGWVH
jgi:methylated-DNA-protein-cysteine methyltransferase related protein